MLMGNRNARDKWRLDWQIQLFGPEEKCKAKKQEKVKTLNQINKPRLHVIVTYFFLWKLSCTYQLGSLS